MGKGGVGGGRALGAGGPQCLRAGHGACLQAAGRPLGGLPCAHTPRPGAGPARRASHLLRNAPARNSVGVQQAVNAADPEQIAPRVRLVVVVVPAFVEPRVDVGTRKLSLESLVVH